MVRSFHFFMVAFVGWYFFCWVSTAAGLLKIELRCCMVLDSIGAEPTASTGDPITNVHLPITSFARLRESRGGDSQLAQGVLVLTVSLRGFP